MLCMVVVHATMPNRECDSNTILLVDSSESKYIQHDKNIYPEVHEPALPIQHDKNIYPEVLNRFSPYISMGIPQRWLRICAGPRAREGPSVKAVSFWFA